MDIAILKFIKDNLRNGLFNKIMPIVSKVADDGLWIIPLGIILFIFKKTRILAINLAGSFLMGVILTKIILKPLINRVRPCEDYHALYSTISDSVCPAGSSFPSGHVTMAFAGAVSIFLFNKKWGSLAIVGAIIVAFSRMYMFEHYLTDVLGGALIGSIGALITFGIIKKIISKVENRKILNFFGIIK